MQTGKKLLYFLGGFAIFLVIFASSYPRLVGDEALPSSSAKLGEKLFHSKLLSSDQTISCASCHKVDYAFADNLESSFGVEKQQTHRNTPSIMYLSGRQSFFWDGRARTLEEQALMPIENPGEMNLSLEEAVRRLKEDPYFTRAFEAVFKAGPDEDLLGIAIADYERTLAPFSSPYDQYLAGNMDAISESALRGLEIFIYDGSCAVCHAEPLFSNDDFFNIGLYDGKKLDDVGRYAITGEAGDMGRFGTPTLRNIALTAPYMHNGMFKTLREVLEFYNNPNKVVKKSLNRHDMLRKLKLDSQELDDLEAFLLTLTDTVMIAP